MSGKLRDYFDLVQRTAKNPANKSVARQLVELVVLFVPSQVGRNNGR